MNNRTDKAKLIVKVKDVYNKLHFFPVDSFRYCFKDESSHYQTKSSESRYIISLFLQDSKLISIVVGEEVIIELNRIINLNLR